MAKWNQQKREIIIIINAIPVQAINHILHDDDDYQQSNVSSYAPIFRVKFHKKVFPEL